MEGFTENLDENITCLMDNTTSSSSEYLTDMTQLKMSKVNMDEMLQIIQGLKYLGQEQQAGVDKTILPMTENIHIPIMTLTNIIPQNERLVLQF